MAMPTLSTMFPGTPLTTAHAYVNVTHLQILKAIRFVLKQIVEVVQKMI